jgi:hypothetical protein
MARKAALYLQREARTVWGVYFKRRTVVVQDDEGEPEVRCGENLTFAGVSIPFAAIFEGL